MKLQSVQAGSRPASATTSKSRAKTSRARSVRTLAAAVRAHIPFVENLREGVAFLLPTGEVAYANKAFGELVGAEPARLRSRPIQGIVLGYAATAFRELLADPKARWHDMELQLSTLYRSMVPVAMSAEFIDVGRHSAIYLRLQSLQADKKYEDSLQSGRLNRAIFHNATEAILITNSSGKILRANLAAATIAGLSPVGQFIQDVFPLQVTGRADRAYSDGWSGLLRVLASQGMFRSVEADFRPRMRAARCFLISGRTVVASANGHKTYLVVLVDITALREAEAAQRLSDERYRSLMEAAPEGILIVTGGAIGYVNPAAVRLFGASPEAILGKSFVDFVVPQGRERFSELIRNVAARRPYVRIADESLLRPDRLKMDAEITLLSTPGGEPSSVQVIIRDITESKRAEQQVRDLNTSLEQRVAERTSQFQEAMRDLNGFAYSVAHDLRAPLRAMQGFSRALLDDYGDRLDDIGRDYARRIAEASVRMDSLINDLLAYSRVSRENLKLEAVDLDAALSEALQQLGSQIEERRAQVEVSGPLPRVLGHRVTLTQVLVNLISNGLKFVEPGVRPFVRIRAEQADSLVRISVEDNGIGIAPENQDRIFKVFERLHHRELYPGTGMGLAIVHRALERMGGRVGVKSELGRGSRFWIELPAPPRMNSEAEGWVGRRAGKDPAGRRQDGPSTRDRSRS